MTCWRRTVLERPVCSLVLRGGVINVTDAIPPQLPETASGITANSSVYDNRGRWFFIGANYSR
jgi:hypothetical protein